MSLLDDLERRLRSLLARRQRAAGSGPLGGSTLERAQARLAGMSTHERAAVQALLDGSPDDRARGSVLAALASAAPLPALARLATRLATMTPSLRDAALDPTHAPPGTFTQPDGTTCGSSVLVMSRMLNDPAYAMSVLTGYDPRTGRAYPGGASTPQDRFRDESRRMHEQTAGLRNHDGHLQIPWPRALGTSPSSVANQMGGGDGRSGLPGSAYAGELVDPDDAGRTFTHIVTATRAGETVPLFIGDSRIPRHVVLVTASADDTLTVYDPSSGATTTAVSRGDFENGRLAVAGWHQAWVAVTPR